MLLRSYIENCEFAGTEYSVPCNVTKTMLTDRGICATYNGRSIEVILQALFDIKILCKLMFPLPAFCFFTPHYNHILAVLCILVLIFCHLKYSEMAEKKKILW